MTSAYGSSKILSVTSRSNITLVKSIKHLTKDCMRNQSGTITISKKFNLHN